MEEVKDWKDQKIILTVGELLDVLQREYNRGVVDGRGYLYKVTYGSSYVGDLTLVPCDAPSTGTPMLQTTWTS